MSRSVAFARAAKRAAACLLRSYRDERAEAWELPGFSRDKDRIQFIQGWTGRHEIEALYLLASTVPSTESIVEIGSFCGRSTAALALGTGCRERAVITIDPHTFGGFSLWGVEEPPPSSEPVLRFNLALSGVDKAVDVEVLTSVEAASSYQDSRAVGLLFVDGLHTADVVLSDARAWSRHLSKDGVVVFDDWPHPPVMAGIAKAESEGLLPPRLGTVGRHLVFAPRERVAPITPRLRVLAESAAGNRWYVRDRASRYLAGLARSSGDPAPIR